MVFTCSNSSGQVTLLLPIDKVVLQQERTSTENNSSDKNKKTKTQRQKQENKNKKTKTKTGGHSTQRRTETWAENQARWSGGLTCGL